MGKVVLDMAMSLDGFISGPNDEDGGLHNYFFSPSGETARVVEEGFKTTGSILMGRGAYEVGARQGGYADDPYQVPTFVLSSGRPAALAPGADSFVFVTDGLESALRQARAAAGDRDVVIGGGAKTARAFLKAGWVDELQIHLVPVLFGEGHRLFDDPGLGRVELESTRVIAGSGAIHLKFHVIR